MKTFRSAIFGVAFGAALGLLSLPAISQTCPTGGTGISCEPQGDIDLFTTNNPNATADNPNVLFILDNTSNWSQNSQHFPGGINQGQGEVRAIANSLAALGPSVANINVGMMNFQTKQNPGGQISYAIRPMTSANLTTFRNNLVDASYSFFNNINSPNYKTASNTHYGDIMMDAYNYFTGKAVTYPSENQTSPRPPRFDPEGYTTSAYNVFKKPPTAASGCGRNYIIYVANPESGPLNSDPAANTAYLAAQGGNTSYPPSNTFASGTVNTELGFSAGCYAQTAAGASACSSTEPTGAFAAGCAGYSTCACDSAVANGSTGLPSCASGQQRYSVYGTTSGTPTTTTTTTTTTSTGTSGCYGTPGMCNTAAASTERGGLTCPTNTDTGVGSNPRVVETYSCSYACGTTGGGSCPAGAGTPVTNSSTGSASTSTANTTSCYLNAAACNSAGDRAGLTCPPTSPFTPASCSSYPCVQTSVAHSCSYACGATASSCSAAGSGSVTLTACSAGGANNPSQTNPNPATDANTPACPGNTATRTYSCPGTLTVLTGSQTYVDANGNNVTCTGNGANKKWPIRRVVNYTDVATNRFVVTQTDTPTTTTKTTPAAQNFTYEVTQTITKTTTTTSSSATTTNLGNSFGCYSSASSCTASVAGTSEYGSVASNYSGGLSCNSPSTTTGSCPFGGIRYQVRGSLTGVTPTNNTSTLTNKNAPIWARFMREQGIANTYTIDVYRAQPDADDSQMLNSMAKQGGGRYFAAMSEAAIQAALKEIFDEIQSVNTNFAAAALPISATNRAQNVNQVYIGMFRPNADADPRWHGNLKRYKLIPSGGSVVLGDAGNAIAVSESTGFIRDCATSFWTTDSGTYWQNVPTNKPPARGLCTTTANSPWSDAPDGPFVEKGGTAEVVRKGNGTATTPATVNRNFWTLDVASGNLVPFNTTNTALPQSSINFITGQDVEDENGNGNTTEPRTSIHGDVIHSRPLPVNYVSVSTPSPTTPIAVYYGSNDGTYRGIDANTGKELWAFVAPETIPRLNRLVGNSPKVLLYGSGTASSPTSKDYFFDGSTGVYQPANNSKVWIFPTMHRGGRMIYALDVTNPTAPSYKWRAGCPGLTDDIGCTSDSNGVSMNEIGQTWSFPNVASIKGYTSGGTNPPVIIVGGGYDRCHDANTKAPSCASSKGRVIYVLDAATGTVLRKFATTGGVAADVSLVDVNNDNLVDYAYASDLSGNVWRINFVDTASAPLAKADWEITRVAYTTGAGRKFLHGPAVLPASNGTVYLALGSGDREHPLINQYPFPGVITTDGVPNRFYVYLDSLSRNTATNLDDGTFLPDNGSATCSTTRLLPGGDPTTGQRGWFLSLGSGEQTVTSAAVVGGLVAFSTNTPTNPAAGACTALGLASGYLVDLFTGSGAIGVSGTCGGTTKSTFVGGGLPPSPVIATVPLDDGTVATVLLGAAQKDGSVSSTLQSQRIEPPINPIRKGVYWRRSGDN